MSGRRTTPGKSMLLDLGRMEVVSLQRYAKLYKLPSVGASRADLEAQVSRHFSSQQFVMDEEEVLLNFIRALKKNPRSAPPQQQQQPARPPGAPPPHQARPPGAPPQQLRPPGAPPGAPLVGRAPLPQAPQPMYRPLPPGQPYVGMGVVAMRR